jgi:hypothetical protein
MVNGLLLSQFSAAISGAAVPVDIAAPNLGHNSQDVTASPMKNQKVLDLNIFLLRSMFRCRMTCRSCHTVLLKTHGDGLKFPL